MFGRVPAKSAPNTGETIEQTKIIEQNAIEQKDLNIFFCVLTGSVLPRKTSSPIVLFNCSVVKGCAKKSRKKHPVNALVSNGFDQRFQQTGSRLTGSAGVMGVIRRVIRYAIV